MAVRTIPAGEFKAKCLKLMDEIAATGDTLIVTKRGKPVARVGPVQRERPPLRGLHKGQGRILGDIVSPLFGDDWEPETLDPKV